MKEIPLSEKRGMNVAAFMDDQERKDGKEALYNEVFELWKG